MKAAKQVTHYTTSVPPPCCIPLFPLDKNFLAALQKCSSVCPLHKPLSLVPLTTNKEHWTCNWKHSFSNYKNHYLSKGRSVIIAFHLYELWAKLDMMMKWLKRSQLHQFIKPPWPPRSRGLFINPTQLKTSHGCSHFYQETLRAAVDAEANATDTNWIQPQA